METGVSRDFQLAPPSRTHKTGETGMPAPGRSRFHGISTSLTLDFDRKLKLTDDFPSAGTPFSWARESRLFVVPFSRPKGRTERCCLPSLILSAAQNPLPLLLIYRATSRGSAGGDGTPRGAPPAFSVDEGGVVRGDGGSTFARGGQRQGTGRDSRILSASRGGSGETGWPFRRNGIGVPAQRHHRSGATASRFRRNGATPPRDGAGLSGSGICATRSETLGVPAERFPEFVLCTFRRSSMFSSRLFICFHNKTAIFTSKTPLLLSRNGPFSALGWSTRPGTRPIAGLFTDGTSSPV